VNTNSNAASIAFAEIARLALQLHQKGGRTMIDSSDQLRNAANVRTADPRMQHQSLNRRIDYIAQFVLSDAARHMPSPWSLSVTEDRMRGALNSK
jgi:hypothetical protein